MTKTAIQLKLDPNKLESKFKLLGGGKMDEWNKRLSDTHRQRAADRSLEKQRCHHRSMSGRLLRGDGYGAG